MSTSPQAQSGIEIKTSFFFLAFLLLFFKPQASINGGAPFRVSWGATPVPVPPGRYQVEVWLPYLFLPTMGRNGAVVDIPAGGIVQVAWRAPYIVFARGKVTVAAPRPVEGGAPTAGPAPQAAYTSQAQGGTAPQAVAAPVAPAPAPAAPAPVAAPAGWHPDPAGRHEQRYFDGSVWTDHVIDSTVQSTDRLGR